MPDIAAYVWFETRMQTPLISHKHMPKETTILDYIREDGKHLTVVKVIPGFPEPSYFRAEIGTLVYDNIDAEEALKLVSAVL